jgi:octaprenyl-diphosphate synthase
MERQLATDIGLLQQVNRFVVDELVFGVPSLVMMAVAAEYRCADPALMDIAAITETIQSSILAIHDSIDRSPLPVEGGLPTSAVVLVGDYLTSRAFQASVAVGRLDVIAALSKAIGTTVELATATRFTAGSTAASSRFDTGMTAYAALAGTAATLGAAVAGAPLADQAVWRQYGEHIGSTVRLLGLRVPLRGSGSSHSVMITRRHSASMPTATSLELARRHCAEAALLAAEVKSNTSTGISSRICQLCNHRIRTGMGLQS